MVRMSIPGTVYERDNGKWAAQSPEFYDPAQSRWRRKSLGVYSEEDGAHEALVRFHHERAETTFTPVAGDVRDQKVADYLDGWLGLVDQQVRVGELARRTASGYESAVRLHIRPALGPMRISDLDFRVIHRLLTDLKLAKGLSDQTVLRIYRTLHRAFADAPLQENPIALPKHLRPKVRDRKPTYRPSPAEIRRFLDHVHSCGVSEYLAPMWRMAATTGLRRGELVAVTWDDLDSEHASLRVERSLGQDNREIFVKSTKSPEGRRTVGLDPGTISALRRQRKRIAEDRLAGGDEYQAQPLGHDLVFRWDSTGALCRPDRVSHAFVKEWRHSALNSPATLHSLRHSFGSVLLEQGMSVPEVAAAMGHSPQVLLSVYGRELDSDKRARETARVVSELYGSV